MSKHKHLATWIKILVTRVTISENFASHAAVQEPVDVKPD